MSGGLRSVDEHLAAILTAMTPLPALQLPLLDALDLAAAEDVVAPIQLPRFDNSAMDGYAVRQADVATATDESPVKLPVIGEIGAGQSARPVTSLPAGTAAKIMTGAPVPPGADSVVPYEWTDRGAKDVCIAQAPSPGQHLRYAGEDVAVGDLLVEAGTTLGPRHLGLLASLGRASVWVRPRPRVVIVSTGSELREPGAELGDDSIYDGNSFLLAAAARRAGAAVYRVGIVPDQPEAFLAALEEQLVRADVVVTSGGVSMGDYDVVKAALRPLGTVWFGPVAMQPGKPQGFWHVGPGRVPIFTLPGNPVSAYLSFELFVLPALRKMMGLTPWSRPQVSARLTHAITSPPGRRQLLRAHLDVAEGTVSPVGGPGSHLVGGLADADAVVVVPEDVTALDAGATVSVLPLDTGLDGGL